MESAGAPQRELALDLITIFPPKHIFQKITFFHFFFFQLLGFVVIVVVSWRHNATWKAFVRSQASWLPG